jgi:hypothetical protein
MIKDYNNKKFGTKMRVVEFENLKTKEGTKIIESINASNGNCKIETMLCMMEAVKENPNNYVGKNLEDFDLKVVLDFSFINGRKYLDMLINQLMRIRKSMECIPVEKELDRRIFCILSNGYSEKLVSIISKDKKEAESHLACALLKKYPGIHLEDFTVRYLTYDEMLCLTYKFMDIEFLDTPNSNIIIPSKM